MQAQDCRMTLAGENELIEFGIKRPDYKERYRKEFELKEREEKNDTLRD